MLQLGKIYIQNGSGNKGPSYIGSSMELASALGLSTYRHKEALARSSENQAMYEQALRLKLEALEEAHNSNNLPQIIWAHMLIGDLYMLMGDKQRALDYYQEATVYLDTIQTRASALDASANLRTGHMDLAYDFYNNAGSEVASGIAAMRLGEVALERKYWNEAAEHFDKSLAHFSMAGLKDGMSRAHIMLAVCELELNNFKDAQDHLDRADALLLYDETKWSFYFVQGNLYKALSKNDLAIKAYISSVEIIEKIRGKLSIEEYKSIYLEDKMEVYNTLISLLLESGRIEESFHYSERGRARTFLDMLGHGQISMRGDESDGLVENEQKLRQEIQSLTRLMQKEDMVSSRGGNRSQIEQKLFEIREEHSDIIRKIKLYNKEYSSMVNLEISETQELISEIDPGTAFLSYWLEKDHLYIWMITSDGIESRTVPIDEEEIIELVAKARRTISSSEHKAVYLQLYQKLLKPFGEAIKPFETLCIIPHLELHFLPFQCIMSDSITYLIDNHNVFYTPSLNIYSLTRMKELEPVESLFAMALGGIELGGLSGLPGTTQEVRMIS
jgi:tetratricopeptide (TPR) repeat protein